MPTIELKSSHIRTLKHMLGADSRYKKKQWGFRNHYVSGPEDAELEEMVDLGLVEKVKADPQMIGKNSKLYHATRDGAIAIGFKPYQLRNAHL